MGSLVGHLYPRLVRFTLHVKEQEEKTRTQCRIREGRSTVRIEASGDRNRLKFFFNCGIVTSFEDFTYKELKDFRKICS